MISHLRGTILSASNNYLIVEVNNIGYKVFTSPILLQKSIGQEISLFIYQKVSDSEISLYGLPDAESLEFFEKLISVSGVGPKIALSIISAGNLQTLSNAISNGDSTFFSQVSGVGKKTAERIVVELKDKLAMLESGGNETFTALIGLGYSNQEVRSVIGRLDQTLPFEDQIKKALQLLGR